MWKDFFYFSKTERQGIIALVVLIIGVSGASKLLSTPSDVAGDPEKEAAFEQEYNDFIVSLQEVESGKRYPDHTPRSYPKKEVRLSDFDPNTADSTTFLSLGLPPWMAKNIIRYRSKQGKFRRPEDFRKIYGLTEEQFQTLRPFIHITEEPSPKDTIRLLAEQTMRRDTLIKYPPGTVINLNQADTTELKKIPGIGSGIARMIVNYRKRLGGFYRIEQLQEIHLKVERLRSWFSIDVHLITRINLNKASPERMMRHPYINFYQAKVITEYRKKKGKLKSLKLLALYDEFTTADFERISPYVIFD